MEVRRTETHVHLNMLNMRSTQLKLFGGSASLQIGQSAIHISFEFVPKGLSCTGDSHEEGTV